MENNNLIYASQHGFRSKRSCLTNLLEFLENVINVNDENTPIDVFYLDFKKAFDKVPHARLILKLQALGLDENLIRWIRVWLQGRTQRVVVNGACSEWSSVLSGVPQGSVLGPVLFLIYINDLDEGIKSKIFKFADDAKMMGNTGSDLEARVVQDDLDKLTAWAEKWQMEYNVNKCKVMHFGNKNGKRRFSLGLNELTETKEERDLGIIICDDLKVHKQCIKAANKGNQVLGLISRTFSSKKRSIVVKLNKSLVRPHLDYCSQAWNPHYINDIETIEKVQRRATRMIEECKNLKYEDRLRRTRLTTLETRRIRADLLEVFKIVHGLDNIREDLFFTRSNSKSYYTTRGHSFKFFKKRFNTDTAKYSFGNRVVDTWNNLPEEIVQSESFLTFKIRLDHYIGSTLGLL